MADIPENLIDLERTAEEERAGLAGLDGEAYDKQWRRWREASAAVHAAVAEYAAREDVELTRLAVEQAVKKAVRHPE
ncbi:hypothetical protein [Streptomyces sp. NPDC046860]|uniref:hypothetical protein n=1 Tax=Streptomyces sp. NPDC046860 TaxID=3154495 RepID=UPI0033EC0B6D